MDKSYVSMEQAVCPVCCQKFDTGSILMDTRVQDTLEPTTVTGWALCPEHERLHEDGFVALISIDPEKSGGPPFKLDTVYRTGAIMHIRRTAYANIFGQTEERPFVFADDELLDRLNELYQHAKHEPEITGDEPGCTECGRAVGSEHKASCGKRTLDASTVFPEDTEEAE